MHGLGSKIKLIRKNLKLSQVELAKELNITQSTLSKYESDFCFPPYVQLQKLKNLAQQAHMEIDLL